MFGFRIEDGTSGDPTTGVPTGEVGCLNFDLVDVLRALGERVDRSYWRCDDVDCFGPAYVEMNALAAREDPVLGADLLHVAERITQVIDGTFTGRQEASAEPWVILHAIDSAFWEVWTNDPDAVRGLGRRFRAITPITASAL